MVIFVSNDCPWDATALKNDYLSNGNLASKLKLPSEPLCCTRASPTGDAKFWDGIVIIWTVFYTVP